MRRLLLPALAVVFFVLGLGALAVAQWRRSEPIGRYQLTQHNEVVVRLDTSTGAMEAFLVAAKADGNGTFRKLAASEPSYLRKYLTEEEMKQVADDLAKR